jgi:hypothetical protein
LRRLLPVLALLPAVAFAQKARDVEATSQQGSGAKAEPVATPGPGIESGTGDSAGRTDWGPTGVTGLVSSGGPQHERALARANDQARGENEKGSFLRPAETAAQLELNPRAIGSGADDGAFPMGGRYYLDRAHSIHGKASGIASGQGNPGGSAAQGAGGKSERTQ